MNIKKLADIKKVEGLVPRLLLVVALIVPIGLLYWSISTRLPLINQSALQIKEMHQVESEVTLAKATWSKKEAQEALEQWESERSLLLDSYESLSAWLENVSRRSRSIGVKMSYMVGELKPAVKSAKGVSIIPVEMKFRIMGGKRNQNEDGYLVFMGLLKDIMEQQLVMELVSTDISGSGSKANIMKIVVNTWVRFGDGAQEKRAGSLKAFGKKYNHYMLSSHAMEKA